MPRSRDILAQDGVFSAGWRIVRPGGKVKVANSWFQHDKLLRYVGEDVFVTATDYWFTDVECRLYAEYLRPPICTAKEVDY